MSRNTQSHFSTIPQAEIQRSTFDLSANIKTSLNVGDLVPFYLEEVLPGDTFDVTTSKVVRSQTMLTPVMDNVFLDTYYFFVPNRLVWKHWNEFCGENTSGAWAPSVEYSMPCMNAPAGGFESGTIADYFGLPLGIEWKATDDLSPSALPFRAYALICNEFFRDQNLSDPLLIPLDDAHQDGVNTGNYISDCANGGKPFKVAKMHGYFESCLPSPQKGSPVGIPISVPVFNGGVFPVTTTPLNPLPTDPIYPLFLNNNAQRDANRLGPFVAAERKVLSSSNGTLNPHYEPAESVDGDWVFAPNNLAVNIPAETAGDSGSTDVTFSVNELRLAFAYQRFLEAMARSGSRYTETLLSLFGVKSPDSRLQRPEYLGGNRIPINVHEVTNNAQTDSDYLGDIGAKSQTNDLNYDFIKSFTEHGYVIGLMCIRHDHSYSQGMPRTFTRKTFTDFYNPKFANLGEVPVYQAEIYATKDNLVKDKVFGYQEIWSEYRVRPSLITGEMRPGVRNSLSHWHLGDYFSEVPTLSDEWIRESPNVMNRVLAVSSDVAMQFWADIYVQNKATRPMPMYSVPGMLDHF